MTKSELIEALKDYSDDTIIYVSVESEEWDSNGYDSWMTTRCDILEATNVGVYAPWDSEPGTVGVKID
jgi:hypothetical protein